LSICFKKYFVRKHSYKFYVIILDSMTMVYANCGETMLSADYYKLLVSTKYFHDCNLARRALHVHTN
jgi:hypothetical protein